MLMMLARMPRCVGRADIIEFGRRNLRKLQSVGLFNNGIPSEATLCRLENGIDSVKLTKQMAEFSGVIHDELAKGRGYVDIIYVLTARP